MSLEDLERKPIQVFFKEGVLRTLEGWIWLATTLVYLLLGLIALFVSAAVMPRPELRPGFVFIAFSWPVAAFLVFLTVCSPHYKTTPLGVVVTALFSLIGFAILYR